MTFVIFSFGPTGKPERKYPFRPPPAGAKQDPAGGKKESVFLYLILIETTEAKKGVEKKPLPRVS
jgi:hypothetical protein